jgi:hypothetical protein
VTRAQAASPGFVLSDINARDVSEICRRLDGMPLAIELAAARVRHLSPAEIEVRVGKQLDLLAGPNTAPARHRTLRAALDWSYGLLSPAERLLLNRLSVFSGSFTLEAAEGICGEAGLESAGVLDVLSHLIDKSLVQVEETTQGCSVTVFWKRCVNMPGTGLSSPERSRPSAGGTSTGFSILRKRTTPTAEYPPALTGLISWSASTTTCARRSNGATGSRTAARPSCGWPGRWGSSGHCGATALREWSG